MSKLVNSFLLTDLNNEELINKTYTVLYISYFDHFLNEEEYIHKALVCYADIKEDFNKERLFTSIENKFIKIYKEIYELAGERVIIINKGEVLDNISYDVYQQMVVNALKENPLCEFFYPSLNLISLTGYDFTHQILISRESNDMDILIKKIYKIVCDVEFYLLED